MLAEAWTHADGYSLVQWRDVVPEEIIEDVAALQSRLTLDAPTGDLAVEQQVYDADRVRGQEATELGRGYRSYSTAARHDATGQIVARTKLSFESNDDTHARQRVTIVEPAHRGRRLGLIVKSANHASPRHTSRRCASSTHGTPRRTRTCERSTNCSASNRWMAGQSSNCRCRLVVPPTNLRFLEVVDVRYYQAEHESAYRKIKELGYTQWNDLFDQSGAWTYDDFQNRAFLERVVARLDLPAAPAARVLEYGCGTGPAACFLAARGFQVDAIDLIPEAITLARRMAEERGVRAAFRVADICDLASEPATRRYDVVLDSYCLQSIVTDQDRSALFSAVRARLKPSGYYVISTALRVPGRQDEPGFYYDASTGIYYREIPAGTVADQVVEIDGRWYLPHRRHLSADALRDELVSAGFRVLGLETSDSGDLVCRLAQS